MLGGGKTRPLPEPLTNPCVQSRITSIKVHAFFDDFDWKALERKELPTPLVPEAASEEAWQKSFEKLQDPSYQKRVAEDETFADEAENQAEDASQRMFHSN